MPVLLLVLLVGVLGYMWFARRGSSLTRACRWRLDRSLEGATHHCVACGARCTMPPGKNPRKCLRVGRGDREA